jgi:hypothetical protein
MLSKIGHVEEARALLDEAHCPGRLSIGFEHRPLKPLLDALQQKGQGTCHNFLSVPNEATRQPNPIIEVASRVDARSKFIALAWLGSQDWSINRVAFPGSEPTPLPIACSGDRSGPLSRSTSARRSFVFLR